ncbi:MAG: hypothetical protein K1Y02_21255 [Candidatus Hydrogenedentes bacterium]|nr:hypothetical protein [Candidatus Hydrogenedentota bacterium]
MALSWFGKSKGSNELAQLIKSCQALGVVMEEGEGSGKRVVKLAISHEPGPQWFTVTHECVTVYADQAEGLCSYANLEPDVFLLLGAILGIIQWRALILNPLLASQDDLRHAQPSRCLFAEQPTKNEYALVLEDLHICRGCLQFYRCLGGEGDIEALLVLMARLRDPLTPSSYIRLS